MALPRTAPPMTGHLQPRQSFHHHLNIVQVFHQFVFPQHSEHKDNSWQATTWVYWIRL